MLSPCDSAQIGVLGMIRVRGFLQNLTFGTISMGFARLAESAIRKVRGKGEGDSLGAMDKIFASSIGGALATWNQPIEVIRVEVRSVVDDTWRLFLITFPRCNPWLRTPTDRQN